MARGAFEGTRAPGWVRDRSNQATAGWKMIGMLIWCAEVGRAAS